MSVGGLRASSVDVWRCLCLLSIPLIRRINDHNSQLLKFVIFPEGSMGTFFALLSFFIHLNLALYFLEDEDRALFRMDRPLSFRTLYCLSGVAPAFSSFLNFNEPWKICWWCITPFVVFSVQRLVENFNDLDAGLTDLEKLKYNALGA